MSVDQPLDETVRVMVAENAIRTVLYRYCRGLDRMDMELSRSVWHPDSTADYGDTFRGSGSGFLDWIWPAHAAMASHSHQITNVLIDVDLASSTAVSEAYVTVALRSHAESGMVTEYKTRGRYLDRWSCRGSAWAIDSRRFVSDLSEAVTRPEEEVAIPATGRRDREDPSFELF